MNALHVTPRRSVRTIESLIGRDNFQCPPDLAEIDVCNSFIIEFSVGSTYKKVARGSSSWKARSFTRDAGQVSLLPLMCHEGRIRLVLDCAWNICLRGATYTEAGSEMNEGVDRSENDRSRITSAGTDHVQEPAQNGVMATEVGVFDGGNLISYLPYAPRLLFATSLYAVSTQVQLPHKPLTTTVTPWTTPVKYMYVLIVKIVSLSAHSSPALSRSNDLVASIYEVSDSVALYSPFYSASRPSMILSHTL